MQRLGPEGSEYTLQVDFESLHFLGFATDQQQDLSGWSAQVNCDNLSAVEFSNRRQSSVSNYMDPALEFLKYAFQRLCKTIAKNVPSVPKRAVFGEKEVEPLVIFNGI